MLNLPSVQKIIQPFCFNRSKKMQINYCGQHTKIERDHQPFSYKGCQNLADYCKVNVNSSTNSIPNIDIFTYETKVLLRA